MMNKEEIWKDIKGFPNYQISDLGRIKVKEYSLNKIGRASCRERV